MECIKGHCLSAYQYLIHLPVSHLSEHSMVLARSERAGVGGKEFYFKFLAEEGHSKHSGIAPRATEGRVDS